jgi:chorismate mutase/prephenate dehydratase
MEQDKVSLDARRKRIDAIDEKILKLLEERVEEAHKIGEEKKRLGKPIKDSAREEEVLEHVIKSTKLEKDFVKKLFKLIVGYCRDEQN